MIFCNCVGGFVGGREPDLFGVRVQRLGSWFRGGPFFNQLAFCWEGADLSPAYFVLVSRYVYPPRYCFLHVRPGDGPLKNTSRPLWHDAFQLLRPRFAFLPPPEKTFLTHV